MLLAAAVAVAQPQPTAGKKPGGAAILPNGWTITPAGKQIPLSTLPMSLAAAPDGRHAVALNAGYLQPSASVIDLQTGEEVQRLALPDAWLGLRFIHSGERLFIGGGSRASVLELEWSDGRLKLAREFPVVPPAERTARDFIGDVAVSPDGGLLYALNLFDDSVVTLNARSGLVLSRFSTGPRPYRIEVNPDGETAFISEWGGAGVGLYRLGEGRRIGLLSTGRAPGDLLLAPGRIGEENDLEEGPAVVSRLFVACSNTNSVWVYGLTAGLDARLLETVPLAPTVDAPPGTAPTELAYDPESKRLLITASGANFVAVADVSGDRTVVQGAVPTGWRPTAALPLPGGGILYLNGKGGGSSPAPNGPDPTDRGRQATYVAAEQTGSAGLVPPLDAETLEITTARVVENTLYSEAYAENPGVPAGNPVRGDGPIQHVIYVLKENRSFGQILGETPVFGPDVAPNHHALARRFVTFDNFYADGDVSADGQAWSTAAATTDFVEKLWPARYGRRLESYPFEGADPAAFPPGGYLWSSALSAGLSVRNYGVWTSRGANGALRVADPALEPVTAPDFPPFDLEVAESTRVEAFLTDLEGRIAAGAVPRLMLVRLPNDHTAGRAPGALTTEAMMAEHDLALGNLVEGVSRSKIWPQTAIFIVEDDAQDGADPVDSHRTVALAASPYVRRGARDSTFYSTVSMLRTMELILGLRPMTQFDAAATPMWQAFQAEANAAPYEALEPEQSIEERNPAGEGAQPRRVSLEQTLADD